jgi:predicted Zn-dependent protease
MNGRDLLALCKEALSGSAHDAEIFAQSSLRGFARFAMVELGQHMQVEEPHAIVRVARGEQVAEASTSDLRVPSLRACIEKAAAAARNVPRIEGFPGFTTRDEPSGPAPERFSETTARASAETRTELLAPVLTAIRQEGLVAAGMLETTRLASAVATTGGCARAHDGTVAAFKVWALETAGAGGAAGFGGQLHRDLSRMDLMAETQRAIRICKMGKNPIALDAGSYDVVMEPEAVSELLEWLGTIGFGAPEFEQGTSPMVDRIGERITGESISLYDDPLTPGDFGIAAPFDREGTWRDRVPLVDKGIARGILYDRTYGKRMGKRSTGSSLLPDFGAPGGVGPAALSLEAGTAASVDELIAGMDRGLYVCRLHYVNGLLETRRAVMTGLTRDGCFLVEKGKITRPVGNMRFTDSFLEGLARCDGMTRDRRAIPTWWSSSGAVITPAVRMRGFVFNGKSQEIPRLE